MRRLGSPRAEDNSNAARTEFDALDESRETDTRRLLATTVRRPRDLHSKASGRNSYRSVTTERMLQSVKTHSTVVSKF
jgi:hypothetical protein